jgi:hypothetical protein
VEAGRDAGAERARRTDEPYEHESAASIDLVIGACLHHHGPARAPRAARAFANAEHARQRQCHLRAGMCVPYRCGSRSPDDQRRGPEARACIDESIGSSHRSFGRVRRTACEVLNKLAAGRGHCPSTLFGLTMPSRRSQPDLPADIEDYRDTRWRREGTRQVETAHQAERFVEEAGFAFCLTDSRRPGPSLYIAVCGRRDAVMPRNVQKDTEASATWLLKDEVLRRGKVYYAKLARGKAMFLAPRLIPAFHAVWGLRKNEESTRLSRSALAILRVLRREWEMSTADLREESGVKDRRAFTHALDELQAAMIVVPSEVYYQPKFTYIWTLAVARFPDALRRRVRRDVALAEIARGFLDGAGMTVRGELSRVTGLSRVEAGRGNRALVAEGYAECIETGVYRLVADRRVPIDRVPDEFEPLEVENESA